MINWIREKITVINNDKVKKSYRRIMAEFITDFFYKRKFWKLGIDNPANYEELANTNSKSSNADAVENQPSGFYATIKAIRKLPLPAKEIQMFDIGCGSGRLLCYGMVRGFASVSGIDLDETGVKKALENCKLLYQQGFQTPYDVRIADATICEIPSQVNVVYMFNPFGEKTMEAVLLNIANHVNNHKKFIYLVYVLPIHNKLFEKYPNATVVYEDFYKNGERDMVIYKINPN